MIRLAIKLDPDERPNIPCVLCGRLIDLRGGPSLYVEGTRQGVCLDCGELQTPGLAAVLRRAALHEGRVDAAAEADRARGEASEQSEDAEGIERMAVQHARMIDELLDHETLATLRALEQELVQRGRLDVLLRNGVWALTEEDPEYQANELVRAAFHRQLGVVPIERPDAKPLYPAGIKVDVRDASGVTELPGLCCICRQRVDGKSRTFLVDPDYILICANCVEKYDVTIWDQLQLERYNGFDAGAH